MRRMLVVAAILAATAPVMGQTSNAEKELTTLAEQVEAAFARNDAAFLDSVNADDWTFIGPGGVISNKTQAYKNMRDGTMKVESAETLEMKVRVFGDTGLVTGLGRMKATYKGKPITATDRWTDVYIKRDGKWRCVSTQLTPVAAESEGKKP